MRPNPPLEGTAHLRRFAGRWVPSSLRSLAAPQLSVGRRHAVGRRIGRNRRDLW